MNTPQEKAAQFLKNANYFSLGSLPTEKPNQKTKELTNLANNNIPEAVELLQNVDIEALTKFQSYFEDLTPLREAIHDTLKNNGRIFLCGCGATGRLSLSLEFLWRQQNPQNNEAVIGFMAGGDVALVNSIEGFEDFAEYGAEHLMSLGFNNNDLLISTTEGGETTFVIGATEKASLISKRKPFFLYCNPKEILIEQVERSRRVILNPQINNICLEVGSMSLSGSTRMQASTVLMLGAGLALFNHTKTELTEFINYFSSNECKNNFKKIAPFIERESDIYKNKNCVLYSAENYAITVFTDTTERSPTFNLPPMGNKNQPALEESIVYLTIPSTETELESWHKLLARSPRQLNWGDRNPKTTNEYLLGFDFSKHSMQYRKLSVPQSEHFVFAINFNENILTWNLQDLHINIELPKMGLLFQHIFLKMMLNIHSTLIMARMGRTYSNFMTYVSPTNGKLIDRAARYVQLLLEHNNIKNITYSDVVFELFNQIENLKTYDSVVIKTYEALLYKVGLGNTNKI